MSPWSLQTMSFWQVLLILLVMPLPGIAGEPGKKPAAKRELRVLVVEGSPRERGVTHGKAMKAEIHSLLKLWKADLQDSLKMDADKFIKLFVQKTDFMTAIKKWTPDLLEEIAGIGEGAGVDFDTIFVFQLPDEVWAMAQDVVKERCSCLGFSRKGDRPAYAAQNLDLPTFYDGFQLVLHVKEKDTQAFVLTTPGFIAANGMNNKGIAICCNTLLQLKPCRDGLPVACVVRGVLAQQSEKDAVAFLRQVKHASGQNYVLAGKDKAWDFECSAGAVHEFTPKGQRGVVWHTNHPLVSDDYQPRYAEFQKKPEALAKILTNTRVRLECLETRLANKEASLDLIKATLRSKDSTACPVCRPNSNRGAFTFASTIAVLSDEPTFFVAPGPPDVHDYSKLTFGPK